MKIIGIDLSLTGTGLATIEDTGQGAVASSIVVTSSGSMQDNLDKRFDRQSSIAGKVLDYVFAGADRVTRPAPPFPDLVVLESLFNSGTVAGALIDRAGLWWRIVGSLLAYNLRVVTATPQQGKKFLTGAGNADKGAMAMYASKLWSDWSPASAKNANDEADALAMASIGWGRMMPESRWPFPETEYRVKIIRDLCKQQPLEAA